MLREVCLSESVDESERVLRRELQAQAPSVLVGGGDGTLSFCANLLAGSETAMGTLPLGTGNTFARSIGLPLALEEAAAALAEGRVEAVDVGSVNGRVFLNSVTLGLSAKIADSVDSAAKSRWGLLAWPVVGLPIAFGHRPLSLKIVAPGHLLQVRTHQLVVSNGRYIAGPLAATPGATVQDACLRVFTLGGSRRRSLLRATLQWLRGRHTISPDTEYFAATHLRIDSPRRPVKANVDGELCEQTPLEFEVVPRALRLIVPRDFQADQT